MVSVIVPNYNHAQYLRRRIDSILNQTYQDFELILLDDCSTDESADILNSYSTHPKVAHVVINEVNTGSPFKQWDKGFELAKGDYIWIAESDDWCEATLLENLVRPLESDLSISTSFCQTLLVDSYGKILYRTKSDYIAQVIDGISFIHDSLFGDPVIVNAGMVIFRRSLLRNINKEYLSYKGAGDWMFWIQLAKEGNVYISGKSLNYCYRHEATLTSKSEKSGQDYIEGNKIFTYVLENTQPSSLIIRNALETRISIYFAQRKKYETKKITKKMKKDLFQLHPKAPRAYYKYRYNKLLRLIFFVFTIK